MGHQVFETPPHPAPAHHPSILPRFLVSCREDFTSSHDFVRRESISHLRAASFYESSYSWGSTFSLDLLESRAKVLCDSRLTTIFVHGYNSSFRKTLRAYLTLAAGLNTKDQPVLGFLWPGHWLPEFGRAWRASKKAGEYLALLLDHADSSLTRSALSPRIRLIGHSLGCRVILEALRLRAHDMTTPLEVHLTAPAIDYDAFETDYKTIAPCKIHVYHSQRDGVLTGAYRFGRATQTLRVLQPWKWLKPAMGAVGPRLSAPAPRGCQIFPHNFSALVDDHGGYRDTHEYYKVINHGTL